MNNDRLMILARYLLSGEYKKTGVEFTMDKFMSSIDDYDDDYVVCNTAACAVGHATLIDEFKESFREFQGAYFTWSSTFFEFNYTQWSWCFSAEWTNFDNTPEGAAKRILYLLENDGEVPEGFTAGVLEALNEDYESKSLEKADALYKVGLWVDLYIHLPLPEDSVESDDIMNIVRQFSGGD